MIDKTAKLSGKLFRANIDLAPTREGFGQGLLLAGQADERVVALCADLTDSTKVSYFAKAFPERFVEVGVAEQLLATVAAGMAAYGKVPFVASYAAFCPGRTWEQLRTTAALNDVPVKIAGCHAGVSVGPDGATHQALEDIATMRSIPNMVVISPGDALEAQKATLAAAQTGKPAYIRLARAKTPTFSTKSSPFAIGKANRLTVGDDVTIVATGPLVYEALLAYRQLKKEGIGAEVLNMHTIKPLDAKSLVDSARKTGCVVSAEEHQVAGGLGGAVAEALARKLPTPQEFVGMPDCFGESAAPEELLEKYKMTGKHIAEAAHKAIRRKK